MMILTATEIITLLGLDREFPPCDLKKAGQAVKHEFRCTLGWEFYLYLKECLAEYPCVHYATGTEYAEGDVVVFNGIYRKALKTTSAIPSDADCWGNAPKFTKPCLEELWCEYLGEYLAWSALLPQLPFLVTKIKHGTVVRIFGDGFEGVGGKSAGDLMKSGKGLKEITLSNMHAFMLENNKDGCYDKYKGLACKVRPRKTRKGWRVA